MKNFMLTILMIICIAAKMVLSYSPGETTTKNDPPPPEFEYLSIQDYMLKNTLINSIRKRIEQDPSVVHQYSRASFYITRSAFIHALALISSNEYIPLLESCLSDSDQKIIADTLTALGHMRHTEAETALQRFAKNHQHNAETASSLINALSNYFSDSSADIIISFYNRKIKTIQFNTTVITALGVMGTPYAANLLVSLYPQAPDTEKLMIIENLGYCRNSDSARLFLSAIVQAKGHQHFVQAVLSLGMLESQEHIPLFLELLHDESNTFVPPAAQALSYFSIPWLVNELLKETDEKTINSVNRFVYDAIAKIISTWTEEEIISFITDNNLPGDIAMRLAELNDPSSIKVLEEILAHEDPLNRLAGLFALNTMNNDESRSAIMRHLPYAADLELRFMIPVFKQWLEEKTISFEEIAKPLSRSGYFREKEAIFSVALNGAEPERVFIYLVNTPDHPMNWLASYTSSYLTYDKAVIRGLTYSARKGLFRERYYAVKTLIQIAGDSQEINGFLSSLIESEQNTTVKKLLENR